MDNVIDFLCASFIHSVYDLYAVVAAFSFFMFFGSFFLFVSVKRIVAEEKM